MKTLPLILLFALLGVNTPFRAQPKEPAKPETLIETEAAWDAMFTAEAMENVTVTTHTELSGENGYVSDTVILQDGDLTQIVSDFPALVSWEQYYPSEELLLRCVAEPVGYFFTCEDETEESREIAGSFLLAGQYGGRFSEAVYNAEEGCYDLITAVGCDSVYAVDGRLVKIVSRLGEEYVSVTEFTDYGTTVPDPLPAIVPAADVRAWDNTSFAEESRPSVG